MTAHRALEHALASTQRRRKSAADVEHDSILTARTREPRKKEGDTPRPALPPETERLSENVKIGVLLRPVERVEVSPGRDPTTKAIVCVGCRDPMNRYDSSARLGRWLWLLTALFALRVVAQPLSLIVEHPLLPRFDAWHSDALPYGLLVASQILILAAMSWTARGVAKGTLARTRSVATALTWIGAIYFLSMLARLTLGVTLLGHIRWFGSWLPTIFHLALATFLWLVGRWHHGVKTSRD